MADYQNLKIEKKDQILIITIDRPQSLNALNRQTMAELGQAIQGIYENPDVRSAIITGSGEKAFVAGADISEFLDLNEVNGKMLSEKGQESLQLIEICPKPIVAAVNGYALGGGCELAMACHIRVATPNAVFGQPEVNLGIIPGFGGTQRLTQLVGKGKALEIMMTGDNISAQEALAMGLVNHIVESHEQLLPKCEQILTKIMSKAPVAIGMVIKSVNAVFEQEDGYQVEANSFGTCCNTRDFKEGAQAFLEKRKANFKGD